ncbi:MAG: RluA family pseudouridine synthase [Pirellulales bacterium]|nr:RluA family pseudouridine synthase [Pirellulales bacterium]
MGVDDLQILREDGACLVVLKPAGLLTQAPPGIDSMEARIRAFLQRREGREAEEIYLGVPHRLDRPASGAMVFCTKYRATRKLAEQFENRSVKKVYWALASGRVLPDAGTWEDYLRKIPGEARAEIISPEHPEGRAAVLHYRTLAVANWGTWLEIQLETGRTHQVRVQAAARGYPLLGDALYGSTVPFGPQHEDERLRAIALHARTLEFRHPGTKEIIAVTAPVGEQWKKYLSI